MKLDDIANKILIAAYNEAKHQHHEYFTPEHILYASLFFDEGRDIIESCGGKIEKIKSDLLNFFTENMDIVENREPIESLGVNSVMQSTAYHCMSSGKDTILIGDIIVALYSEKESFASYILQENGIRRIDVLKYISHGVSLVPKSRETSIRPVEPELPLEEDEYDEEYYEFDMDEDTSSKNEFLSNFTTSLQKKQGWEKQILLSEEKILLNVRFRFCQEGSRTIHPCWRPRSWKNCHHRGISQTNCGR